MTRAALHLRIRDRVLTGPNRLKGTLALAEELRIPSHRGTESSVDANLIAHGIGFRCFGCGFSFFNPRIAECDRPIEARCARCAPGYARESR